MSFLSNVFCYLICVPMTGFMYFIYSYSMNVMYIYVYSRVNEIIQIHRFDCGFGLLLVCYCPADTIILAFDVVTFR